MANNNNNTGIQWTDELTRQVAAAANAAGDAAAEEVWAAAIFAANNASRRLQSNVALEAKIQSDQLINTPPIVMTPHSYSSLPPPPPLPSSSSSQEEEQKLPTTTETAKSSSKHVSFNSCLSTPPRFVHAASAIGSVGSGSSPQTQPLFFSHLPHQPPSSSSSVGSKIKRAFGNIKKTVVGNNSSNGTTDFYNEYTSYHHHHHPYLLI